MKKLVNVPECNPCITRLPPPMSPLNVSHWLLFFFFSVFDTLCVTFLPKVPSSLASTNVTQCKSF